MTKCAFFATRRKNFPKETYPRHFLALRIEYAKTQQVRSKPAALDKPYSHVIR